MIVITTAWSTLALSLWRYVLQLNCILEACIFVYLWCLTQYVKLCLCFDYTIIVQSTKWTTLDGMKNDTTVSRSIVSVFLLGNVLEFEGRRPYDILAERPLSCASFGTPFLSVARLCAEIRPFSCSENGGNRLFRDSGGLSCVNCCWSPFRPDRVRCMYASLLFDHVG